MARVRVELEACRPFDGYYFVLITGLMKTALVLTGGLPKAEAESIKRKVEAKLKAFPKEVPKRAPRKSKTRFERL